MDDFVGNKILFNKYKEVTADLNDTYHQGVCMCFAGPHGIGKTMTCANILKDALIKGYQCLYVTLSDIVVNAVSNAPDKYLARKELMMVDFLVIDEFDGRHMTDGASADLFGRQLEDIFRKRSENRLPTFMCTNSPSVTDAFDGPVKHSISSLMSNAQIIPVLDRDFRKRDK
jgi:DNA replication protein DnaC